MKKVTFILSMLLALACSTVNARTITRCFDSKSQKFCVRMDGQLMTIEEYDNWLYENRPSAYAADTVLTYWMKRHLGERPSTNSRNYRGCTFATRTMKWGGKTLTAWAVIDDSGHECSHWVFAGSGEGYGCRWLLEEAGIDYVNVTLQLCADTICWTWGYLDENGKLMMWTGEDDNGKNKYIPWDWKRVDA
jgi:hypothetical protein